MHSHENINKHTHTRLRNLKHVFKTSKEPVFATCFAKQDPSNTWNDTPKNHTNHLDPQLSNYNTHWKKFAPWKCDRKTFNSNFHHFQNKQKNAKRTGIYREKRNVRGENNYLQLGKEHKNQSHPPGKQKATKAQQNSRRRV